MSISYSLSTNAPGPKFKTGVASDTANFFDIVHDHMVANGWTDLLVISGTSGSKKIVMQGGALDPIANNRPFVCIWQSGTNFCWQAYEDYDVNVPAGIHGSYDNYSQYDIEVPVSYWIRADQYAVAIVVKTNGYYYSTYFGYLRRGLPNYISGMTKTSTALAVGATALPVASDMTGKLKVGQRVWVLNYAHDSTSPNADHAELVTITSISSTSIGVSALVNAYDAGALVGYLVNPIVASDTTNSTYTPATTPRQMRYSYADDASNSAASVNADYTVGSNPNFTQDTYETGMFFLQDGKYIGSWRYQILGWYRHYIAIYGNGYQNPEDYYEDWQGNTYICFNGNSNGIIYGLGPRES